MIAPSAAPLLRVFLVEDSAALASRISQLIGKLPEVELVGTAGAESQAISGITAVQPDVIVLDLQLPQGSGFGVLRSLAKGARPLPRIIILTKFSEREYRQG